MKIVVADAFTVLAGWPRQLTNKFWISVDRIGFYFAAHRDIPAVGQYCQLGEGQREIGAVLQFAA